MDTALDTDFSDLRQKIQSLRGPILVLGASGFVGANLLRILVAFRDDVTGTTTRRPAWRLEGLPKTAIRQVDVLVESQLDNLLESVDPKTVFDCIGYGGYPFETDSHRIYATNFDFLNRLLPQLASRRIAAYVHAGSSSEYGTNSAGPGERDFTAPNSDYAVSKIAAANLIYLFGQRRQLPCANLRLYSAYGPFEDSSRLVPQIIQQGSAGKLPEFVNPEISRDFLYVDDAVSAFVHAALFVDEAHWGESFNIGTGLETTIAKVADMARKIFQIEAQPSYSMQARDWDVPHWFANIDRARSVLHWEPRIGFRQGLVRTWGWYRALDDQGSYQKRSKKHSATTRREISNGTVHKEHCLFNLNSLCHGADRTLLDYVRRCLSEFDGCLVGVEMGVGWGGGVEAMARLWKGRGKVYGFDTFEGPPVHLAQNPDSREARSMEPHYAVYGRQKLDYAYQRGHLDGQGIDNAILVKGLVTENSCDRLPRIHYCLLDLDMGVSMTTAYRAVKNRIVPGGYLCIHDYIGHGEVAAFLKDIVRPDELWNVDREFPDQDLIVLRRNPNQTSQHETKKSLVSVGMITCDRPSIDVRQAIDELRQGGFDEILHLFCEPGTPELEPMPDVVIHRNETRLGVIGNWSHCLRWLLENTAADYLLVCEDDVAYCHGARTAWEQSTMELQSVGFWSLYTPRRDRELVGQMAGWVASNRGRDTWGSQSLCFPRSSAEIVLGYPPLHNEDQMRGPTDAIVAQCFVEAGIPCYYHNPSLADHVGRISTVGHNWYDDHVGFEFDPEFQPSENACAIC